MFLTTLRYRLIFLSILPIVVAASLLVIIINHEKTHIDELKSSMGYINEVRVISEVLHDMQSERGYSIGCSSKDCSDKDEKILDDLRKALDGSLDKFNRYDFKIFDKSLVQDNLDRLLLNRQSISSRTFSHKDIKEYYTDTIDRLIDSIKYISKNTQDKQVRNYIVSYSYLANAKESLGLMRARVNRALILDEFYEDELYETLRKYKFFAKSIDSFLVISSSEISDFYHKQTLKESYKETFSTLEQILKSKNIKVADIDSNYWFAIATKTINLLKATEDKIFDDAINSAKDELGGMYKKIAMIVFASFIAILAMFLTLMSLNKRLFSNVKKVEQNRQTSQSLLEQYSASIDASSIVSKTDKNGIITFVNDEFCKITGFSKDELVGSNHNLIRHPDTPLEVYQDMWHTIKDLKKPWSNIVKNKNKDGSEFWAKSFIYPILDEQGEVVEYIATRVDITELVQQKSAYERVAVVDSLTELGSRYKLKKDIEASKKPLALAIVNIDSFREVNDFYGHDFGDKILLKLADILKWYKQKYKDIELYRVQADEFALLSSYRGDFERIVEDITSYIRGFKFEVEDEQIIISCSCGISYEPNEHLLSSANMALKLAKKSDATRVIYDEDNSLEKEYENNIKYTKKLTSAIENDRLVAYYQSIVDNKTGNIHKYESLIRMIDEDGEVVSPFFFLEIAKRSRKYFDITKKVLEQSFELFKDSEYEFSINLSIKDIADPQISDFIVDSLKDYSGANRVVFELVESESVKNFDLVNRFIHEVKSYGAKIAIDDFGTGYSNFEYLAKLKADYLKIDGSLIKHLAKDQNTKQVVLAIVKFAKALDVKCIAEFVEDEAIYEAVKELGIEYSQGYYFSKPQPTI